MLDQIDKQDHLNEAKSRIQAYVESRMSFIAPNLSIIVGSSTAAKIMGEIVNSFIVLLFGKISRDVPNCGPTKKHMTLTCVGSL